MYDYLPPRRNKKAAVAVLLLLIASATALGGAPLLPRSPLPLQCVGLALLIPAIQLAARYLLLKYLYRLRPYEDGGVDLEIYTYRGGDRMQLVCRVALSEITAVVPLGKKNAKPPLGIKRFSYAPDLSPADAVVLSVENGDGASEVLIVPDERMRRVLQMAVSDRSAAKES